MNSGSVDVAAKALDFNYGVKEDGSWDFENLISISPISWSDWLCLKIRDFDDYISTPKLKIRVPTVIVAINFNRMPLKTQRVTKKGIWERDNATCQISGEKLTRATGNIAHDIAKAKNGKDSWENQFLAKKELNTKQGTKSLKEMGWKLLKTPKAPLPVPFSVLIKEARVKDWEHFILK